MLHPLKTAEFFGILKEVLLVIRSLHMWPEPHNGAECHSESMIFQSWAFLLIVSFVQLSSF